VLGLPVIVLVVVLGATRSRRLPTLGWLALGLALGAPWYALNLARTGELDGGLGGDQDQLADHSFRTFVSSFRALVVDLFDLPGTKGANALAYVAAGLAIVLVGAVVARRRREPAVWRDTLVAGAIVMVAPFAIRAAPDVLVRGYWKLFHAVGRRDIAIGEPWNWDVSHLSDTSLAAYGPVGLVAVCFAAVAALVPARRVGLSARRTRVYTAAPFVLMLVFALTIVWNPWQGRLQMFAMALPVALLGRGVRTRWLAWVVVGLAVPTTALVLAVPLTKPSGLPLRDSHPTIWGRERIDALTILRFYDGTPQLLRSIDDLVPGDATLAVASPVNTYLAPMFGPRYDRTLLLVADGQPVPERARWLALHEDARPVIETGAWETRYADERHGWRILERTTG
jgi:hypothetical protein